MAEKEQEIEVLKETQPTTPTEDEDTTAERKGQVQSTPYRWQLSSLQQQPA